MLTTGVDIIEIKRIENSITRFGDKMRNRIFTKQEQAYCASRITSLAGRYAIKEAVSKALGTGIGDVNWTDIEVINNERGKPELKLHNRAQKLAEQLGITQWSISISHTNTHAIGFVVGLSLPSEDEDKL
ncbi:MAG: holo-[acyl-carrier-protein] synthase [Chloroflexi bacterium]|nr:MAG: holo-[acyl-carrier-protein] synthase [Chloroflexota bacterium]PIE79670.1 MAG: holo-[acyl-carrier-protein] synthase [Chloroflexota bacterium]